jgi:hypothetical protein
MVNWVSHGYHKIHWFDHILHQPKANIFLMYISSNNCYLLLRISCMDPVKYDHILPLVTPSQPPIVHSNTSSPQLYFTTHYVQLVLPICAQVWCHRLEHGKPANVNTPWFSLPQQPSPDNSPSVKPGAWTVAPQPILNCWLPCTWAGLMQLTIATVRSWMWWLRPHQKTLFCSSPPYSLVLSLSTTLPVPWRGQI